jgi:hypothetical protein
VALGLFSLLVFEIAAMASPTMIRAESSNTDSTFYIGAFR